MESYKTARNSTTPQKNTLNEQNFISVTIYLKLFVFELYPFLACCKVFQPLPQFTSLGKTNWQFVLFPQVLAFAVFYKLNFNYNIILLSKLPRD